MKVRQYHVDQNGLHQFFGTLEARIMELMWRSMEKKSVRQIHENLQLEGPISFNAVMTVLNRLWEKDFGQGIQGQGRTKTSYFQPLQSKKKEFSMKLYMSLKGVFLTITGLSVWIMLQMGISVYHQISDVNYYPDV
ncbi:BlaI/MecI/CopY family transcriptional regulator [Paenibacillus ginsengarvi]|uniref:BlaI/MecI/CopY family transcriptional regulator n=1 Tax=Paenibacillus ginsengarvi TaxID=400777 RepID=A0A3B0BDM7_9BACL|nr:BlaI/MecI/CopY family transcriptional regulator [Paenibacillus ginsengarvi]RKN70541.1 hypothetical protein D7M11_30170 [Paenibacillus ginsengarvi]